MKDMRRYINVGTRLECAPFARALSEMHVTLERYTFTDVAGEVAEKVMKSVKEAFDGWISLS
jgi:hypothetical protein